MDPFEQLRIETPEQIALELTVAGLGSRFLALFIDTVIQAALCFLAIIALVAVPSVVSPLFRIGSWGPALLVLFIFCLWWGYFTVFEILWKGQTPGKRVAGVRVIKETGRPLDIPSAILRNLLRAVDFLPALYGVGVACMLLNRHSRRLGDYVAGTMVVHDHGSTRLSTASRAWGPRSDQRVLAPRLASSVRIAEREVMLIEAYLGRRLDLDEATQDTTAWRIARLITARTGLKPATGQSVDDFLEAIARHGRDAGA